MYILSVLLFSLKWKDKKLDSLEVNVFGSDGLFAVNAQETKILAVLIWRNNHFTI